MTIMIAFSNCTCSSHIAFPIPQLSQTSQAYSKFSSSEYTGIDSFKASVVLKSFSVVFPFWFRVLEYLVCLIDFFFYFFFRLCTIYFQNGFGFFIFMSPIMLLMYRGIFYLIFIFISQLPLLPYVFYLLSYNSDVFYSAFLSCI